MTPSKLSKSVLKQIEKQHVEPLPKGYFIFRNILWWLTFLTSIIFGGMALAVIIFSVYHQRFDFVDFASRGHYSGLMTMLPFFWILFFGVFVWASFWGIGHTKKAYRMPRFLLISLNILCTFVLGVVFYTTHQAEVFEHRVGKKMFHMKTVRESREARWEKGESHGMLAGEIKEILEGSLVVLSFKGEDWAVDISEARMNPDLLLEKGMKVGMRGEVTGEKTFKAEGLRPWNPEGMRPGKRMNPEFGRGERKGPRGGGRDIQERDRN